MSALPRVRVLHGLWMHAPAMRWFAARLRGHGFDAVTAGYYSVLQDTEAAVARIAAAMAPGDALVAHSLGGLIALRAAAAFGADRCGRIVCLGTPVAGSAAAAGVEALVPAGRRLLRAHAALLREGCTVAPGLAVGMVAGCVPHGLGGLLARFDGAHDGTVAVSETRVEGLADHVVVRASHSGLIFSADAVQQAAAFLRDGRFEHVDATAPSASGA